jgi:deazaflavin-dependent oxidoreductase (nitroreductase family)
MHRQTATTDLDPTAFLERYNRRIVADGAADMNQPIIADYRASGGPTGVFTGAPILLLTTTGARTGQPRTAPLVYARDGDRFVVVASRAGAAVNPAWYHNLLAHPLATVELGTECFAAVCSFAADHERDRLFADYLAQLPEAIRDLMQHYRQQTTRHFPIVTLERTN